jgi:uncharacterized protein YcbX
LAGTVLGLFHYPVKSCRGIALDHATVEARGVRHDRRWMLVDETGTMITQRTHPRLALVAVAIEGDVVVLSATGVAPASLRLPAEPLHGASRRRVHVWSDDVEAVDMGEEAARWSTELLGQPAALVFMPGDVERAVKPKYARAGDLVGFADAFPLLIASASSLDDLNARMAPALPIPMDRFRPNIVVGGFEPWAEDGWRGLRVGSVTVRVPKPCNRCVVTTTDQRSGERGVEPLRTLALFRKKDDHVLFAVNGIPDTFGTVRVGDPVTALE